MPKPSSSAGAKDKMSSSGRTTLSTPTKSSTQYLGTTPSPTPPVLPPIPAPQEHPTLPPLLITGGCGFIGKVLLRYILERHPNARIAIVDKQPALPEYQNKDNITFYQVDLTDRSAVAKMLEDTKPGMILSVAGLIPSPKIKDRKQYFINNVNSTRTLVEECQSVLLEKLKLHVWGFVHTSTSDTIKGTRELAGVDERTPYPKEFFDVYSESKAQGEQIVLAANRPEFPTLCLRPHGIIGAEGHIMPMLHQSLLNNETGVQIGDNKNLYDFVEVENYCAAVLLAAYNLLTVPIPATSVGPQDLNYDYSDQQPQPTANTDTEDIAKLNNVNEAPISAAGHTFFITNLEPVYFWSWTRRVWGYLAQGASLSLDDYHQPESARNSMYQQGVSERGSSILSTISSTAVPAPPVAQPTSTANPLEAVRQEIERDVVIAKNRTSCSSPLGNAIRSATGFSFSTTPPLPTPYKPYSPPPPPFPESSKIQEQAPVKIPKAAGFALAYAAEFMSTTVRGKEPGLTRARIQECCYNRWYRGDKAGRVLGYWGGLAPDSKGYGMGGIGLWYGTKRACYQYLQILEKNKQEAKL